MELVIGRDVRSLQVALGEQDKQLSEAVALHIVTEMLEALDYAHRSVDTTSGEPLHLVHRDVSPQNVLINVEGEIKLIDFGLAERRRDVQEEVNTTATTVMGKMSYMAPEQARGDVVDARADQFAAAIVAYELITNERYYQGLTSQQVWQQAGAGEFRPAGMTKLHPLLRRVIEKALSPHREDRYAMCGEFREALLEYMRDRELHTGAKELRAITTELFAEDQRDMRDLLRRFQGSTSGVMAVPRQATLGGAADQTMPDDFFSFASAPASLIHDPTEIFRRSTGFFERPPQKSRMPIVVAAVVVVAILSAIIAVLATRPPELQIVTVQSPTNPEANATSNPNPETNSNAPAGIPATADAGTGAAPSVNEEPITPVERERPIKRPRTGPTPVATSKVVTYKAKFELLRQCKDPCSKAFLKWDGKMDEIPLEQMKSTKELLDKCYERCRAEKRHEK